jgi:cell wall-associated NlpC family hydrolase
MVRLVFTALCFFLLYSCGWNPPTSNEGLEPDAFAVKDSLFADDTLAAKALPGDTVVKDNVRNNDTALVMPEILPETKNVKPASIVAFAKSLTGVPYVYGSTDPKVGFDCSGFITYVFNHFNIKVPRSSVDFTNVGREIDTSKALPGDLILFTGTNPMERHVGHMGIVTSNGNGKLEFIHSTSGKAMSVMTTELSTYYRTRFVKVIRIF